MDLPSHIQKPKLCSLRRWENFAGYGFNLHSDKGKQGQFIGKVDPNSPADLGGLKSHVEDASHNIVVGRVKSIPDRVDLFVCHPDTYKYCKENDIKLSSALHNIDEHSTPARQPPIDERGESDQSSKRSPSPPPSFAAATAATTAAAAAPAQHTAPVAAPSAAAAASAASPAAAAAPPKTSNSPPQQQKTQQSAVIPTQQQPQQPQQQQQQPKAAVSSKGGHDPVGNVSLDEVRSRIGQSKRNQVKMSNSSFSEKYSVFESL